jgi:hypothetical protein
MDNCWTINIGFIDQIAPIVFYRSYATITGGGVKDSTSTVDASVNAVQESEAHVSGYTM